jgi:protein-L-isoaspartate(D-aspartate) O-methyltransferase
MAWHCSGVTNDALVSNLVQGGLVTQPSAISAMQLTDRAFFVPSSLSRSAYEDRPLPLGHDVTISAPHMHAMMLDLMAPHLGAGSVALDVGSGSGYIVACMARMGAKAYGIEHIVELVAPSIDAVAKSGVARDQFEITSGDGRLGLPARAPFNVIHVGAAAQPDVIPVLTKQLKPGGILIIPVEEGWEQSLYKYWVDDDGKVKRQHICGVRFVPLCAAPK